MVGSQMEAGGLATYPPTSGPSSVHPNKGRKSSARWETTSTRRRQGRQGPRRILSASTQTAVSPGVCPMGALVGMYAKFLKCSCFPVVMSCGDLKNCFRAAPNTLSDRWMRKFCGVAASTVTVIW